MTDNNSIVPCPKCRGAKCDYCHHYGWFRKRSGTLAVTLDQEYARVMQAERDAYHALRSALAKKPH